MFRIKIKWGTKPWRRLYHIKGGKLPDRYELTMGLSMKAWTAGGIIEYLESISSNATLVNIKSRKQFDEYTLVFEEIK